MKWIFLLILTVLHYSAHTQKQQDVPVVHGFGEFVLGAERSGLVSKLEYSDSIHFQGVTDYIYIHRFENKFEWGGIQFLDVALMFNENDKLKEIHLSKIYTIALYPAPGRLAKKEFREMKDFLSEQLDVKGRQVSRESKYRMTEHEWKTANSRIIAVLQESPDSFKRPVYGMNLVWKQ